MRLVLLLVLAGLAGCVDPDPEYDLQASGVPAWAQVGLPFTFEMTAQGTDGQSTHIGGHYWSSTTADPDAAFDQAGGCAHLAGPGDLPGEFVITCTMTSEGTQYLRGHVRVEGSAGDLNFWTAEHAVEVVHLELRAEAAGSEAVVGQPFTFELHVNGSAESDHIGAHYWDAPTDDPTADFADQAGGCQHQAGTMPGVFTVTCTWDEAGTYHVYGHVRLGQDLNLWAPAFEVQVA